VLEKRVIARILRRMGFYLALMKPRVIELLLVTTAPVMVLAAGGLPDRGIRERFQHVH
jgi:protoheme IX farnesyltransferase